MRRLLYPYPFDLPVSLGLWNGIYQVLFAFRTGAPVVLMDRFDTTEFAVLVRRFITAAGAGPEDRDHIVAVLAHVGDESGDREVDVDQVQDGFAARHRRKVLATHKALVARFGWCERVGLVLEASHQDLHCCGLFDGVTG